MPEMLDEELDLGLAHVVSAGVEKAVEVVFLDEVEVEDVDVDETRPDKAFSNELAHRAAADDPDPQPDEVLVRPPAHACTVRRVRRVRGGTGQSASL